MADPAASAEQERTLDRLEQQSEAHRVQLARTVEQLRDRVSPESIRADLKQRASQAGRGMLADLERKVLDNPLQTAAVGAGLAYPAWQLLRHLPAPILLLGAGVALAGRGSRKDEPYERSYGGGTGASSSTAHSMPGQTSGTLAKAGSATSSVYGATEAAGETIDEVGAVQRTASSAPEQTGEFASDVRESASRTASVASHSASTSYQAGVDATSQAAQRMAAAGRASREGVNETVERYPLVVGGVGLLLGAALAACIPSSRAENRLLGETSERLKDQARGTAAHVYSEAKAGGERIVENTMDEAQEQGLTPHGAEKVMQEAGGSARAVADRAAHALVTEEQASPGKTEAGQATGRQDNS